MIKDYMVNTAATAKYPRAGTGSISALMYLGLGITGESGEVAEQIKKAYRDDGGKVTEERLATLTKELGDVAWYWARLCWELGLDPEAVLRANQDKLFSRKERGVLSGSGNDR